MPQTIVLGPDPAFRRGLEALRHAPVTLLFLSACVVLFVAAERQGSTEDVDVLVRFGALERGHVWAGELWRLVSAAFLHIGALHLVWNVVAMLGWCVPIERALGSARFAALYLGSAVAGSAASLLAWDVVGAGASGVGFGMVAATFVLDARRVGGWRALARDRGARRMAGWTAMWMLVLAGMGVDHAAHLGGFVGGLVLARALSMPAAPHASVRRRASIAAALVIAVPAALAVAPRGEITRYGRFELARAVSAAFELDDVAAAERLLAEASAAGVQDTWLAYHRALLLERRGDLDGAASGYAALASSSDPAARRQGAAAARTLLAWRLMNGAGMAADPARGRKLFQEACSEGDHRSCEWLDETARQAPARAVAGAPRGGPPAN